MKNWNNKWKEIFWGILFIATAAFIVVMKLGSIHEISVVKIIFTVIFAGIMITSIPSRNFACVLFPAAFICIIFSDEFHMNALTPVPVLIIALLGTIGLSLIFKKKSKWNSDHYVDSSENWSQETVEGEAGEVVEIESKFSGAIKYVKTDNFAKAVIRSSFGGTKVYFDGCQIPSGKAEINLDSKFGGVELYVPRNWKMIIKANNSFGGLDEKNRPELTADSPEVYLTGSVNFSGVEIIYE